MAFVLPFLAKFAKLPEENVQGSERAKPALGNGTIFTKVKRETTDDS